PTDGRVETHHIELLLPMFPDHEECHRAIRRTGRPQPCIAYPRHLLARPPRPLAVLLQVVALDLPPIGQCEGIGTLPFHEEGALVRRGDVTHELRITKPTIRDNHRRGQLYTAPTKGCHASIQHALDPVQFVPTWPSRTWRGGTPDGKVHGHHEFALANDHDQEDPINTREHAVLLPTPPGAHE